MRICFALHHTSCFSLTLHATNCDRCIWNYTCVVTNKSDFLFCSDTTNGCDVNNGGCDQICSIDQNSVMCSCNSGYLLNSDGVSCGGKYAILVKSVKS